MPGPRDKRPDKPCPRCADDVPYWNDRCYSCGFDFSTAASEPDPVYTDLVLVFSYPGRTQADAAKLFGPHAKALASQGYRPISQSWSDGRPGAARVFALGVFAESIRPEGFLTVTYERRGTDDAAQPPAGDLGTRLRQLAEARELGLISEQEFQAQRQRILESV